MAQISFRQSVNRILAGLLPALLMTLLTGVVSGKDVTYKTSTTITAKLVLDKDGDVRFSTCDTTVDGRVVTNVPVYTSKAREAELKQQASHGKTVKLRGQFSKVDRHRFAELGAEVEFATDD